MLSEIYNVIEFDNGTYEATVWWTDGDCVPDDVEYNLTLTDQLSAQAVDYIMKQRQMTLTNLTLGIEYTVSVSLLNYVMEL